MDRVRLLGDALMKRGYKVERLGKEFRRVLGTYRTEFERWDIPIDSQIWFNNIFSNPQITISPDSTPHPFNLTPFSQPLPDNIGHRFNFLSQH